MFSDSIYDIFPQSYYTDYESEYDKKVISEYSTKVIENKLSSDDKNNINAEEYGKELIPDPHISNDGYEKLNNMQHGFFNYSSNFSNNKNNFIPNSFNGIIIQPIVLYFIMFIILIFSLMQYQTNKTIKKIAINYSSLSKN